MKFLNFIGGGLLLLVPAVCPADTFMLITGQSGADTKINAAAESDWYAASFTPNCLVASCSSFAVPEFNNVTIAYQLSGGDFDIKESVNNTNDMTLSLWDGNVGGTIASPTGATLVASVTIAAGSVGGSYTPTLFMFTTPVTLQVGHSYVVTLTSPAPSNAGWFIKSPSSPPYYTILDPGGDPPPQAPEPSTLSMTGGALSVLVGFVKRRRAARSA